MAREFSVIVGINAARARSGAREFKAGADTVTRSTRQMDRQLRQSTRRATALITTIGRFRGVATLAFSGFLGVGGLTSVVRTLSQFQTEISRVTALISAQNPRSLGGAMGALTERARDLGATTLFTATQAAEGMRFLTLAGFEALDVFTAIEPTLNLAAAGMLDLGQAADITSNIMAAFGIEATEIEGVVDALAFTASRTNTNIQQLGEAMKFVGPVAGALGINVEDTAVALGILGNSGLQASLAGTSLRRVMSGILGPSKEAMQVFESLGVTQEQLVTTLQGPDGLVNLVELLASRGIDAADAFTLFGQRGAPGLLSLVNQRGKLRELTEAQREAGEVAKEQARILADNLGGDARIALSALQEAILRLGDSGLLDWLRSTTQGFTGFIRALSGVKTPTDDLTEAMKKGIRIGTAFRENWELIKKVLVVLTAVVFRNLIFSIASLVVGMVTGIARAIALAASFQTVGQAMLFATVASRGLIASLTPFLPLIVAVGAAAAFLFIDTFREGAEETMSLAEAADTLAAKSEKLVFVFDKVGEARKRLAIDTLQESLRADRAALRQYEGQLRAVQSAEESRAALLEKVRQAEFDFRDAAGDFTAIAEAGERLEFYTNQLEQLDALLGDMSVLELEAAIEELNERIANGEKDLEGMLAVMEGTVSTLKEFREGANDAEDATDAFGKALKDIIGLEADEVDIFKDLVDDALPAREAIAKVEEQMDLFNKVLEAGDTALDKLGLTSEDVGTIQRFLQFRLEKATEALNEQEEAAEEDAEALQKIIDRLDPGQKLIRDYASEVIALRDAFIAGLIGPERFRELLELLGEELDENQRRLRENCEETDEFKECQSEVAKEIETIWDQAWRNVQDAFADAFRGAFDSFEDFADRLLDAFKDMIANMLAAWFTSGIKDIFKGVFNPTGGSGGGGIFSGGFGGLKDIFSKGVKGLTEAGKKFLGALGNFGKGFGQFFGIGSGGTGVGATLGGVAAAGLTGFASGTVVDSILGGRGKESTTNLLSGAGGIIGGLVGGPIGALIGGAIGSFASNLFGGAKKLESATANFTATQDGFVGELEKVISKQRSFFRGRKFKTTTEALDTSSFNEALDGVLGAIGQIGESLGVDAESALSGFRFERSVNVKGKSEEEIAELLSQTFNDAVLAAIREFINNAEGLSDRLTRTVRLFQGNSEEFIAAFEAAAAIDLALAVDPVEQATKNIADANKTLGQSYSELLSSYRTLVEEYDGSLESLQTLSQATVLLKEAQLALATALIEAGDRISETFQNSAQTIREALLNEEELFNLRKTQIDELVAQAQNTTDPQELQRLAEEINRLGLDAFNILDESQQQELGQDFIDFFEELDELFGDQVQVGLDNLSEESSAIDQEVADSMTAAAQSIIDANNAARDLWDEWRDWIRRDRRSGGSRLSELVP